jgi:hypothetical protein
MKGAFTLGTTFDPVLLQRLGAIGAVPDLAKARQWYQRAADLAPTLPRNNWRVWGTLLKTLEASKCHARRSSGTVTDEGAMMEMPCVGANNLAT